MKDTILAILGAIGIYGLVFLILYFTVSLRVFYTLVAIFGLMVILSVLGFAAVALPE